MNSITLCMIVKNEENNLERCLTSIAKLVDEIVIVDTGSIDNTYEIAKKFTSKVYKFKWENDFATARNFAASYATKNWILVLDADEYVEESNFKLFKKELFNIENKNLEILIPKIISFIGSNGDSTSINFHERIYLNNRKNKYQREIHEELVSENFQVDRAYCKLNIYHSGYLDTERKKKNKTERNMKILKAIKNKTSIDYYYLGNELTSVNKIEEAINAYTKSYKLEKDKNKDWILDLLVRLIGCLIEVSRLTEAKKIADACIETHPNIGEFLYFNAYFDYINENYDFTLKKMNSLLENKEIVTIYSDYYTKVQPLKIISNIHLMCGNFSDAVLNISNAIKLEPKNKILWKSLIEILSLDDNKDDLNRFIQKNIIDSKKFNLLESISLIGAVSNEKVITDLNDRLIEFSQSIPNVIVMSIEMKKLFLQNNILNLVEEISKIDIKTMQEILNIEIFSSIDLLIAYTFTYDNNLKLKLRHFLENIQLNTKVMILKNMVIKNNFNNKVLCYEEYIDFVIRKKYIIKNINS